MSAPGPADRTTADPADQEASTGDESPGAGRYAPSPSGDLHLGNLRTAILAWVLARRSGRAFHLRVEDLDRVREGSQRRQLEDLAALGIDWDGEVVRQSERGAAYESAIDRLVSHDLVFECYCTRREILEAPSAPHAPPGAYPGTCRDLSASARETGRERMRELRRDPALRLRADVPERTVQDLWAGSVRGPVDDLVLRRGDGVVAYNLAVVVDDAAAGVDQVTRADDLLSSAPRQAHLAHLLGLPEPGYAHVPLAVNAAGTRLAKRDGAVTLRDRLEGGEAIADVVGRIGDSLGLPGCRIAADVLERWDPSTLDRAPWVVDLPT
ncbi:tRNA glutamyl-Q(34) synthetase GluQRS [Brachybacterium sp. FME24]|uniref:tRNA glutamyl-Q(34) synthetase GluQRS n=1 Tax=Brachybacterium sp. FME24 TaxID=2742605 RepID=UPI0018678FF8|nr:tRNA glutamyl-Q(34) synthetase GluQRS [Brachybacterium sp. FME24]